MTTTQTITPAKPRRERPKAVRLTDAAAARIRDIMADADGKYQGVRVGVTNGGCAGMSYTMDYAEFNNPNQTAACGCGESVSITPAKAD
jgi:iron-sulfur cluster assembly protein